MKRIGLLGGMGWESSITYYRFENEEVRDRLGGLHSANCLLRSLDFAVGGSTDVRATSRAADRLRAGHEVGDLAARGQVVLLERRRVGRRTPPALQLARIGPKLPHLIDRSVEVGREGGRREPVAPGP